MEALRHLNATKVANYIPSSVFCQPVSNPVNYMDPFDDMIDLEKYINQRDVADDLITNILYVLDGTVQLLSPEDINKKFCVFVKYYLDDVCSRKSLKDNKIRWFSKRIDSLKQEIAQNGFLPNSISKDMLLYLSLHLNLAMCLVNFDTNTCSHVGWDRFDSGFIFVISQSKIEIMHDPLDPSKRFFNPVDKGKAITSLGPKVNHLNHIHW
jgi:hypothetical protein